MKNCHSCALASDEGERIRCKFSPRKLLEGFPFYPVFAVNARAVPVSKDKIPNKDCPAHKDKKPGKGK